MTTLTESSYNSSRAQLDGNTTSSCPLPGNHNLTLQHSHLTQPISWIGCNWLGVHASASEMDWYGKERLADAPHYVPQPPRHSCAYVSVGLAVPRAVPRGLRRPTQTYAQLDKLSVGLRRGPRNVVPFSNMTIDGIPVAAVQDVDNFSFAWTPRASLEIFKQDFYYSEMSSIPYAEEKPQLVDKDKRRAQDPKEQTPLLASRAVPDRTHQPNGDAPAPRASTPIPSASTTRVGASPRSLGRELGNAGRRTYISPSPGTPQLSARARLDLRMGTSCAAHLAERTHPLPVHAMPATEPLGRALRVVVSAGADRGYGAVSGLGAVHRVRAYWEVGLLRWRGRRRVERGGGGIGWSTRIWIRILPCGRDTRVGSGDGVGCTGVSGDVGHLGMRVGPARCRWHACVCVAWGRLVRRIPAPGAARAAAEPTPRCASGRTYGTCAYAWSARGGARRYRSRMAHAARRIVWCAPCADRRMVTGVYLGTEVHAIGVRSVGDTARGALVSRYLRTVGGGLGDACAHSTWVAR
ncbi:hypothetical protein C8J57DRAFT_1470737 [Mycena rebaudengoi]|nr:hypothetical protein C8J57DRAFT_1470737 [Mycena rebaudengoi]